MLWKDHRHRQSLRNRVRFLHCDNVLLIIVIDAFQVIENLEEQFVENNITLITSEVFNYDPTSQIENLKVSLNRSMQ